MKENLEKRTHPLYEINEKSESGLELNNGFELKSGLNYVNDKGLKVEFEVNDNQKSEVEVQSNYSKQGGSCSVPKGYNVKDYSGDHVPKDYSAEDNCAPGGCSNRGMERIHIDHMVESVPIPQNVNIEIGRDSTELREDTSRVNEATNETNQEYQSNHEEDGSRDNISLNFMIAFQIGIHNIPQVFSVLTPLGKYVFILRFIFLLFQIGWSLALLFLYWNTPAAGGYMAMFSIWLFLAVISLQIPLYFCISQPHLNDPDIIVRERRKRFLYSWMDTFFLIPFIINGILMFNGPAQSSEFPLLYYSALIWLILAFSYTFFPALLACFAVLCLPCLFLVFRNAQAREEARVRALGASEDLIRSIPILRFKKAVSARVIDTEAPPISPFEEDTSSSLSTPIHNTFHLKSTSAKPSISSSLIPHVSQPTSFSSPQKKRYRLFNLPTSSLQKDSRITIPHLPYQQNTISIPTEDATCSICLGDYIDDEELRQLPCNHHYHVECIDEWLKRNAMCPQCRTRDLLKHSGK